MLLGSTEKIGSQAEVSLVSKTYNEIGQLTEVGVGKAAGESSYLNATRYRYNERGWAQSAISPVFSYQLSYHVNGGMLVDHAQYNGNITQQQWWHGEPSAVPVNTFGYRYDGLNRLLSGSNGLAGIESMTEELEYDDMGNIRMLRRDGKASTYSYEGNRLSSLSGALNGKYSYDDNGNALRDRLGMDFTYNYLNLPQSALGDGKDISFKYDATGNKLQKVSIIGSGNMITTSRDYINGIEYHNGSIDLIHNSAGYALKSGDQYVYYYNLKDHLGNVRATVMRGQGGAVDVVQRDNYCPFGKRRVVAGGNNKYLYNGKEIQEDLGDQYDYGARFYDAEVGRWNVVDPLADKMRRYSPYNYAFNNPVRFIDPDGMAPNDLSGGEDDEINSPFFIARLFTTAVYDAKHTLYNNAARVLGSDFRARYKTVDGSETFETEYYSIQYNNFADVGKELLNTVLDFTTISSGKIIDGNTLMAKSGSKSSASREVNSIIHGNSRVSDKINHGYGIFHEEIGLLEYGVSSQKRTASQIEKAESLRITQKLKQKYKNDPKVFGKVLVDNIGERSPALNWEQYSVDLYYKVYGV